MIQPETMGRMELIRECASLRRALREIVGAGNILSGLVKSSIATASDLHEVRAMDSALSRAESALRGDGS